jgi:DNA-binding response OmpR family regulator
VSVPGSGCHGRAVLVVAGDKALATAVVNELELSELAASVVPDASDAIEECRHRCFDAVVVDLGLPAGSGYRFVAELRESGNDTPVLLLSAPHAPEDLLTVQRGWPDWQPAMREGLHDVPSVLHALLRHERPDSARRLRYAGVTLDRFERRVFVTGHEVALTPAEFGILEQLLQNAEHLVTREALLEAVWGPESEPGSNALDVHLGHLRKKLRAQDDVVSIDTVRGRGHVLKRRNTSTAAA